MKTIIKSICLIMITGLSAGLSAQEVAENLAITVSGLLEHSENAYNEKDYKEALQNAHKAFDLSEGFDYRSGIIRSALMISRSLRKQGVFAKALDYYFKALTITEPADSTTLADIYHRIADLYVEWEVYQKALDYFQRSINLVRDEQTRTQLTDSMATCYYLLHDYNQAQKYFSEVYDIQIQNGDAGNMINTLRNLRETSMLLNDYTRALDYNLKILSLQKQHDGLQDVGTTLNNIGFLYKELGDYDKALEFFKEALNANREFIESGDDNGNKISILMNIGAIYHIKGFYKKSTQHYLDGLRILNNNSNAKEISEIYFAMAANYLATKDYKTATLHTEAAINHAQKQGNLELLASQYKQMSEIYKRQDDSNKALKYFELYAETNHDIRRLQKLKQEESVEKEFEIEKRESDLRLLMAEKEMKELELKKLELETEKKERDIALLIKQKELQDLKLRTEEAEKLKAEQDLILARQAHEAQLKDNEIAVLQFRDSIQTLALKQNLLEEMERQKDLELLKQRNTIQDLKLQEQKKRQYAYLGVIGLFCIILFMILKSYYQNRRITQKLAMQNKEIQYQRDRMETAISQLKAAQSQLVQSEKMASLGQLTAGIAHEINNPINFVYAGVEGLKNNFERMMRVLNKYEEVEKENSTSKKQALLEEVTQLKKETYFNQTKNNLNAVIKAVKEGAARTVQIVNGLRNFSRTDEAILKFSNIHKGIENSLVILNNEIIKRDISISKDFDLSLPEIKCYPGQLNQVFMNIINNAIQAIDTKGRIVITTKNLRDIVKISIKDSGRGMSDKVKEKIFDPFFTTKGAGEGTGLGLSISYGIIQNHKGKLIAYSAPGEGSEFVIFLPKYEFDQKGRKTA